MSNKVSIKLRTHNHNFMVNIVASSKPHVSCSKLDFGSRDKQKNYFKGSLGSYKIIIIAPNISMLKSRKITLLTMVHIVKARFFPVVMYACESWTIKKAERQRIEAFELSCRTRLLRVPWTARRSNQSIQKESVLNIHWKD